MKYLNEYKICKRCVMDTTDPEIIFDENGFCNHCSTALTRLDKSHGDSVSNKGDILEKLIKKIKSDGKNAKYDCIIGLSGGVDSSYLAYIVVKELGLRPLAVHVDNGWNSELAVQNIENLVKGLNIDLYTKVINWDEFRNLQIAYLKAGVIDLEVLSDNAIVVSIIRLLKEFKIKYFLIGHNYQAESIMPSSWFYFPKYDSLNIKSIYHRYGTGEKLKTYPLLNTIEYLRYRYFNNYETENILDLVPYNKEQAIKKLISEYNWRDYGGKHYESKITKFYQAYILPEKFNIDKRKAHLSSLICSNQISREQAITELCNPLYDKRSFEEDKAYLIKKLGLSSEEFDSMINGHKRSHFEFMGYQKIHRWLGLKLQPFRNS